MKPYPISRRLKGTLAGLALTGAVAVAISGQFAQAQKPAPAPVNPPVPVAGDGPPSIPFPPTLPPKFDPLAPVPVLEGGASAPAVPGLPPPILPPGYATEGIPGRGLPSAPPAIENPTQARDRLADLEAKVAAFDGRRADAARAVFQLGECYRKAGHLGEAATQYARVMREFADIPELVQLCRKLLPETELRTPVMQSAVPVVTYGYASFSQPGHTHRTTELRHLQAVLAVLQETTKPEALPANVVDDARYIRLKDDFEAALTSPKSDTNPDREGEIERMRERLSDWLRQVYIPEQENAIRLLTHELEDAGEASNGVPAAEAIPPSPQSFPALPPSDAAVIPTR